MTNFESIIKGIIELSKLDRSEGLVNNEIIIEGRKSGFFSSKTYKLTISKSIDDEGASVIFNDNGTIIKEEVLKEILEDILEKTGMMDNKLRMKWNIVFGGQKLVIRDGKAYLE